MCNSGLDSSSKQDCWVEGRYCQLFLKIFHDFLVVLLRLDFVFKLPPILPSRYVVLGQVEKVKHDYFLGRLLEVLLRLQALDGYTLIEFKEIYTD